jgi:hypothetical protein
VLFLRANEALHEQFFLQRVEILAQRLNQVKEKALLKFVEVIEEAGYSNADFFMVL